MSKTLITNTRVVNEGQILELDVLIDGELDHSYRGKRLDFGRQR